MFVICYMVAVSPGDGFTSTLIAFVLLLCVGGVCVLQLGTCWWFSTFCRITAYYSNAKSLSLPLPLEPSVLRVWQLLCIDFH